MRLLEKLRDHANAAPNRIAYRDVAGGGELSYRELFRRIAGVANRLQAALPAHAVVLICCPNSLDFPVAFLGVLAAGCAAFPISTDCPALELQRAADRAGVMAVIGSDEVFAAVGTTGRLLISLRELREGQADDWPVIHPAGGNTRLLLLSSGSTGTPKIVCRSGDALDAVSEQMCRAIDIRPTDRILATVPLCHSYGIEHGLLAAMWAGATVHLCRGLDLPLVSRELSMAGITIVPGVPSMFEMLAQLGDEGLSLSSVRAAYSAGAPLPSSVSDSFAEKYDVHIAQLYGATEIGSVTYSDPRYAHFNSASVGQPMNGVKIRISDGDGQVWISARSVFSGYLGENQNPVIDGFFPTGDLGEIDEHGNLTITGRIKLLIDIGGLKVNPREVEEVLLQHPDVGDCVIVPMRQSETILRLKAIVTPKRAGQLLEIESLRRFARERLTSHKVPRLFEVRESLPRTATGKLLRPTSDDQ
jgi:long-chain acyl-CoA synthetase